MNATIVQQKTQVVQIILNSESLGHVAAYLRNVFIGNKNEASKETQIYM
jgi:hypothetical protein